jgi:predicted DNA-binding transcriptional regulator AlpA
MHKDNRNALQKSIDEIGCYKVAALVGLRGPSIYKWRENGRLPRTEWTGETNYAAAIVTAMEGRVTREDLLQLPALAIPITA